MNVARSAIATLLFLGACSKDDQASEAGQASEEQTRATEATAPPADEQPAPPAAEPEKTRPWLGTPAIGHVRVAALSTIVDETRSQLAPAALAGMVNTDALLGALAETPEHRSVADALMLDRAMACVLPNGEDDALGTGVCAVAVEGGAKAVAPAFGAPFEPAAPGGHAAHFVRPPELDGDETDPVHVYLDERGDQLLISDGDGGFAALGDVAIAVAARPGRDVELVLYPDQLVAAFGPELRAGLQAVAEGEKKPGELGEALRGALGDTLGSLPGLDDDDTAELDDSLHALDDASPEDAKRTAAVLDALLAVATDVREAGVGVDLEPAGLVFSAWYRAAPESALQGALSKEPRLTPDAFVGLPTTSIFVRGTVPVAYSVFASLDPSVLAELGLGEGLGAKLITIVVETLVEDAADDPGLAVELEAFFAKLAAAQTGASTWSAFGDGTGGPYGLAVLTPLRPGSSVRDLWAEAATGFSPERLLSEDGAKELSWTLKRDAGTIGVGEDQVPVDRWRIHSAPDTQSLSGEDALVEGIVESVAEATTFDIEIDAFERDDVFTAVVTKAGVRALDLVREGSGTPPKGLAAAFGRGAHVLSVWALDLRALRELVKGVYEPDDPDDAKWLSEDVGSDFGDVYGVTYLETDGGVAEMVVSQQLIDQLRAL